MRLLALTIAVLLAHAFSAHAQSDTDSLAGYGITPTSRADAVSTLVSLNQMGGQSASASALVAMCNDDSQQDTCASYIRAKVLEIYGYSRAGSWTDFCPPADESDSALIKMAVDFINNDPRVNQFGLSPADSVSLAFLEASKCSK